MSDQRDGPDHPRGVDGADGPPGVEPPETVEGPEVEALLARFRMPREVAQEILDDLTLALLAKRDRIYDPRPWLLRTLRIRCAAWWHQRRRRLWRVVDRGLLTSLAGPPGEEREALREELRRLVAELAPRCRGVLSRRYGLRDREGEEGTGGAEEGGSGSTWGDDVGALKCVGALLRRVRARNGG